METMVTGEFRFTDRIWASPLHVDPMDRWTWKKIKTLAGLAVEHVSVSLEGFSGLSKVTFDSFLSKNVNQATVLNHEAVAEISSH